MKPGCRRVIPPPYIRVQSGLTCLAVKAQPRASRDEIAGTLGEELKVKVTAPPVDSAANAAVLELISAILKCPRGAVRLLRGASSRHKLLAIEGLSPTEVADRLERAVPALKKD